MFSGVTGAVRGQKLKNSVVTMYASAKMLTSGLSSAGMCQGPHTSLSPGAFALVEIGIGLSR